MPGCLGESISASDFGEVFIAKVFFAAGPQHAEANTHRSHLLIAWTVQNSQETLRPCVPYQMAVIEDYPDGLRTFLRAGGSALSRRMGAVAA